MISIGSVYFWFWLTAVWPSQTSHSSEARTRPWTLLQGGCRPSLILAEILQSFGQVEPIDGQTVHHAPLDH